MFRQRLFHIAAMLMLSLTAAPVLAAGEGWTEDFSAAKEQADTRGKDMLLDFTGSDWCGWCIRLKEEVFSQDAFKAYAKDNFVLVMLDYPRNKQQSEAVKAQNQKLKDVYAIRGYPTIYLTDSQGRPYAKTGYQRGGAEAYIAHLEELKQARIERDEHLASAQDAQGLAKAKHLHAALQTIGDDLAIQHYADIIDQIKTLDADNEAGLKKHYQDIHTAIEQSGAIEAILRTVQQDPEGAMANLDELVAADDTLKTIRQQALAVKSRIQLILIKDKAAAKKTLIESIEADPESEMAEALRQALEQVFSDDA